MTFFDSYDILSHIAINPDTKKILFFQVMFSMQNTLKRTVSFILIALTMLVFSKTDVFAESGGAFGNGLKWEFDPQFDRLTVCSPDSTLRMPDFEDPQVYLYSDNLSPWRSLKHSVKEIVIEEGVLCVGSYAFSGFDTLKTVYLPGKLDSVGANAFAGCVMLERIDISEGITVIEDSAFYGCVSLKKLPLSSCTYHVGHFAFSGCTAVKEIEIPGNLTEILSGAFSGCGNIESIKADKSNPCYISVGNCLVNKQSSSVMLGCKNSVIPSDGLVLSIEQNAFYGCGGLTSINIPNIYSESFSVFTGAFEGCDSLADVYFFGSESEWESFKLFNVNQNNDPLKNAKCHCLSFPDVAKNMWYSKAVQYASAARLITGYKSGYFGAADKLTRQDAVVILSRMSKDDTTAYNGISPFRDVPAKSYFSPAVVWGKKNKIINGYENGKFGTGDKITREQLVCFLYRYAGYIGADTKITKSSDYFALKYRDFNSVSPFAKAAVVWALEKGIISGRTPDTIAPQGYAQRCEFAQILYNIYNRSVFD